MFCIPVSILLSGKSRCITLPGSKIFTITNPRAKDIIVALVKYSNVLSPIRPTLLKSPTFATPITKTARTNGAIIILIKCKKISLNIEKYEATSFF